jgi:hypothetical protein
VTADGWTIDEAFTEFERAGMPVDRTGFRAVVRAAHRVGTLQRTGETPSGEKGGRGQAMYDITRLLQMHKDLVGHIPARDPPPGDA